MQRRTFLLGATAIATSRPSFSQSTAKVLTAGVSSVQLAPEGYGPAELWCFDGTTPGPEIRIKQDQILHRRFQNDLPEASSVHWHGIRLENAMDGVPGLTQPLIPPGDSFEYSFKAPDAGTYWYHSHHRSWEQLARGLYGPLIIDETEPLDVDRDITLVLDDWRLSETGGLAGNFGNLHDNAHAGRLGNFVTINGKMEAQIEARSGDRLRLRFINSANARILDLGWKGMNGWIVALDGMPLETPEKSDRVTLAPAQRADVIVDVTRTDEPPVIFMRQNEEGYVLADVKVGTGTRGVRDTMPVLPPNPVTPVSLLPDDQVVTVLIEGGAMGGLQSAVLDGETLDMRTLAQRGLVWALNGTAGLTQSPLFSAQPGEAKRIRFVNRTAFPHGMHLHGHHFREIRQDGRLGPWRDTILVGRNETRDIALMADNPGKWLLHCHMLGHQAAGMKTWFEVSA